MGDSKQRREAQCEHIVLNFLLPFAAASVEYPGNVVSLYTLETDLTEHHRSITGSRLCRTTDSSQTQLIPPAASNFWILKYVE
jgi:hypothetical protein